MGWIDELKKNEIIASKIMAGGFRLSVHHFIGYNPDTWFMSCYGIFDRVELGKISLSNAKTMAATKLKLKLEEALEVILAINC